MFFNLSLFLRFGVSSDGWILITFVTQPIYNAHNKDVPLMKKGQFSAGISRDLQKTRIHIQAKGVFHCLIA